MTIINGRVTDSGYYSQLPLPLLSLAHLPCSRVLEIGCGTGEALAYMKNHGASYVVGIELVPEIAEIAANRPEVDKLLIGSVENLRLEFDCGFDLIIASHVLEHLVDPWAVLRTLRTLLLPTGQLIGALPNVRHARTILPLLFAGRWRYEERGILDWTHLRFFTRSAILELLQSTGFTVQTIVPEFQSKARLANAATLGVFRNFLGFAYNFAAVPFDDGLSQASQ